MNNIQNIEVQNWILAAFIQVLEVTLANFGYPI
jgi:hypothetical protein